jgi:rhodanese-related sulfurtransferase
MNKIVILLLIVFPAFLNAQENTYKQLDAVKFQELVKSGKEMILDVRTKSEFDNEHIANSQYLNFYALDFKKKLLMLPKDEEIYLYCTTGYRSEKAAKYLAKNGYTKVYNLEHGILEWNLENLPVIEGEPSAKLMADKVSPELFTQTVSSDTLILIDFYATWCGPCRKMMPLIDSIRTQYHPAMKVFKVNVDVSKKLIKQEKIIGVPLFRIYRRGELLFEKDGMMSRIELEAIINKLLSAKIP